MEKRYGNKSKVVTALVSQILAWRFIDSEDVNGLDEFSIFLKGCLNSLKNIPHGMTEVDARTIRQILSRLPIYVTDKWREAVDSVEISESRTPDFEDFVIFIEKIARVAGNPLFGKQLFPVVDENSVQVKTMTIISSKSSCKYCKSSHDIAECDSFGNSTAQEKQNVIMQLGLCFGCSMHGHIAASCPQRKTCEVCQDRHPTSLHRWDTKRHVATSPHSDQQAGFRFLNPGCKS